MCPARAATEMCIRDRYETYFLNLVDSRDLLDIVDESLIEPDWVHLGQTGDGIPVNLSLIHI